MKNIFQTNYGIEVREKLTALIDEYKACEIEAYSVPAGPNSMTFRATVSGMIEPLVNFQYHAGYYGFNRFIIQGIKIGGGVNLDIRREILAKAKDILKDYVGNGFHLHESSGTSWGAIGIFDEKNHGYTNSFEETLNKIK